MQQLISKYIKVDSQQRRSNLSLSSSCKLNLMHSQTWVQRPPLGPEKRGCYAEGCLKNISGK